MTITETTVQNPIIQPPDLLTTQIDPNTKQPEPAFPLQTEAWLTMQTIVQTALGFPLSSAQFTTLYGSFTDEATVETAVGVLSQIQSTATEYGDPTTLITQLAQFQQSESAPTTIYGNAAWLAYQTTVAAQQIVAMLQQGLALIGQNPDPQTRIDELTELLTGDGGVDSWANQLNGEIGAFSTKVGTFYSTLNNELTGPTGSLQAYLNQATNVLQLAKQGVSNDQTDIDALNKSIAELNKEYIGFTVAASLSPVFLVLPFFGAILAIADAATFGTLAAKVKERIDALQKNLDADTKDKQQKASLVQTLGGFNLAAQGVEDDGKAFLDALGTMASGWTAFSQQVQGRLQALTVTDVQNWSAFMDTVGLDTAVAGWNLIAAKAESFFQTGFVQFTASTGLGDAR